MNTLEYTKLIKDLTLILCRAGDARGNYLVCPGCQGVQSTVAAFLLGRLGTQKFIELEKLHAENLRDKRFIFGKVRCYEAEDLFETLARWQHLQLKFQK